MFGRGPRHWRSLACVTCAVVLDCSNDGNRIGIVRAVSKVCRHKFDPCLTFASGSRHAEHPDFELLLMAQASTSNPSMSGMSAGEAP